MNVDCKKTNQLAFKVSCSSLGSLTHDQYHANIENLFVLYKHLIYPLYECRNLKLVVL